MFTIETGAGLAEAESYSSVVAADARCASLGMTSWAALADADKEIALRKAALFMATYRTRWAGRGMYQHQALDWPRYNVAVDGFIVPSTIVPLDIINACIDLAVRAGGGNFIKVKATRSWPRARRPSMPRRTKVRISWCTSRN